MLVTIIVRNKFVLIGSVNKSLNLGWGTGTSGKKYEDMLMKQSIEVFNRSDKDSNNNKRCALPEEYVESPEGHSSLNRMSYGILNEWIQNRRKSKHGLKQHVLQAISSFISKCYS